MRENVKGRLAGQLPLPMASQWLRIWFAMDHNGFAYDSQGIRKGFIKIFLKAPSPNWRSTNGSISCCNFLFFSQLSRKCFGLSITPQTAARWGYHFSEIWSYRAYPSTPWRRTPQIRKRSIFRLGFVLCTQNTHPHNRKHGSRSYRNCFEFSHTKKWMN